MSVSHKIINMILPINGIPNDIILLQYNVKSFNHIYLYVQCDLFL